MTNIFIVSMKQNTTIIILCYLEILVCNMRRYDDAFSYNIKLFCKKRRMGLSKCERGGSCMFIHIL